MKLSVSQHQALLGELEHNLMEQLRKEASQKIVSIFIERGALPSQVSLPEKARFVYLIDEALRLAFHDFDSLAIYAVLARSPSGAVVVDESALKDKIAKLFRFEARRERLESIMGEDTPDREKPRALAKLLAEFFESKSKINSLDSDAEEAVIQPIGQTESVLPHSMGHVDLNHFDMNMMGTQHAMHFQDPHFSVGNDQGLYKSAMQNEAHNNLQGMNEPVVVDERQQARTSKRPVNNPFALPPLPNTVASLSKSTISKPTVNAPSNREIVEFKDEPEPTLKACSGLPQPQDPVIKRALDNLNNNGPYQTSTIQLLLNALEQGSFYHIVISGSLYDAPTYIGNKRMRDDMTISKIYAYLNLSHDQIAAYLKRLSYQILSKYHHKACVSSLDRTYVFYVEQGLNQWMVFAFRPNGSSIVIDLAQDPVWTEAALGGLKAGFEEAGCGSRFSAPVIIHFETALSELQQSLLVAHGCYLLNSSYGFTVQAAKIKSALEALLKQSPEKLKKADMTLFDKALAKAKK